LQAAILALFFLPYILPVSVVYLIWDWVLNFQFGIAMHLLDLLGLTASRSPSRANGSCPPSRS
jgi:multiple sugar transport system permease protein